LRPVTLRSVVQALGNRDRHRKRPRCRASVLFSMPPPPIQGPLGARPTFPLAGNTPTARPGAKHKAEHLRPYHFRPGFSGNPAGAPKGQRRAPTQSLISDLTAAWQAEGRAAIDRTLRERPWEVLKIISAILPKELNVSVSAVSEMGDDEILATISAVRLAQRALLAQGRLLEAAPADAPQPQPEGDD
jgi:hypothetical protein